ncbi:protein BPS1, chloroplastic-like [Malania oleifera]|uniref:protein BPS1, chloroplastic-like n=1 Tax=Malania oleifera TaxID=397392 RepID=UPI0025AE4B99|nr:protein BPS1, chloroplastic-like [Malania oleifera]
MVLLVDRLCRSLKLSSKLENHHHHSRSHHQPELLQSNASFQAFLSDVSDGLKQLCLDSKPGSEFLSSSWIQGCLKQMLLMNRSFAKLVMDIDYPMSRWEAASVEEYLKYSLYLLELLNCISSSLSHLGQARIVLSHALSLLKNSPSSARDRLRAIQLKSFGKDFKEERNKEKEDRQRLLCGKEAVVHQALLAMRSTGFWVCGVVLSSLCADAKPYLEMRKWANGFGESLLTGFDSSVWKEMMEKRGVLKEVKEVNSAVACLVAAIDTGKVGDSAEELKRRLEVLEQQLECVGKDADLLFSEALAARNELLGGLRQQMQWQQSHDTTITYSKLNNFLSAGSNCNVPDSKLNNILYADSNYNVPGETEDSAGF